MIRGNQETRDFLANLEIMETLDLKVSGVHLVKKERRGGGACQEKLDHEDFLGQLGQKDGRAGKEPLAAPATLAPPVSRGRGGSLARTGGRGGRGPLDPRGIRGSPGPAAHTGGGAGQGGQANPAALAPSGPGAMWAPLDLRVTWASRALRGNLGHKENKD